MIVHFLDARQVGGIESHVINTVQALNAAGEPATVLLWKAYPDSAFSRKLVLSGITPGHCGGSFSGLMAMLARLKPLILHTHGYKANIFGRLAARIAGVACVSTFHAGERGRFPVNAYQWLDEAMAGLSEPVAVSQAIAARLGPPVRVLDNFVAVPDHEIESHESTNLVFAGRLSHEKGPDLFCSLAALRPHAGQWHMYGDGPMAANIAGTGAPVEAHGHAADMAGIFSQAGLLVLTSRNEGLPMAALEAMAAGVPVLAPRLGALPDLVTDRIDGLLYRPCDMEDAARQLDWFTALSAEARLAMGQAARARIVARYSAQAVLPQLTFVYAQAVSRLTRTRVQSSSGR